MKILAHMSLIRWTTWHSSLNNIWVHMSYIVGVLHLCCRFLYLKKNLATKLSVAARPLPLAIPPPQPAASPATSTCRLAADLHVLPHRRPARAASPAKNHLQLPPLPSPASRAHPLEPIEPAVDLVRQNELLHRPPAATATTPTR